MDRIYYCLYVGLRRSVLASGCYLTAGTGLFAIFVTHNNQESTMHYTLKDHQGSLTATVHGNTVERLSYDAWGRRRNPVGFGYSNVTHTFDRGYTLHEHYDDFDLINMNGRLYDPVIGRMLSPDIAIQDEHDMQAYNRYSYCFNNPLRFTDPSGYVVQMPFEYYGLDLWDYGCCGFSCSQGSAFNTEDTEGKPRLDEDWIYNKEKKEYVWDGNVHSWLDLPEGFSYVGETKEDVYKHFRRHQFVYSLFNEPAFGKNRTPCPMEPGQINEADVLTSFEMWMAGPSTSVSESMGKVVVNIAYSAVNSPYGLFTGRSIGGTELNTIEMENSFVDFVPGLLSRVMTSTGQIIRTTTNGLEGYNQFVKGAKKSGVQFGGQNWQKQASQYYRINNTNQQSLIDFSNARRVITIGNSTRKELIMY